MSYLDAHWIESDVAEIKKHSPQIWREVRRFNLPVQLAVAAGHQVLKYSEDPRRVAIISLAPCHAGSPELFQWGHAVVAHLPSGNVGEVRMNPTHTLHAVDNLALSALAIAFANQGYCLGLGGSAGQAWNGLEMCHQLLSTGAESEIVMMAGDQDWAETHSEGLGIALLFSRHEKAYGPLGRPVRLQGIERRSGPNATAVKPHAAKGLADMIQSICASTNGRTIEYHVPDQHTNGCDRYSITFEMN